MKPCAKCGRAVRVRPIEWGGNTYGEKCARAVGAPRSPLARRSRKVKADERTPDMFAEVAA